MKVGDQVKNIEAAILGLASHLLNTGELELGNIRRVSIKTSKSPSLPVYSHLTDRELALKSKSK